MTAPAASSPASAQATRAEKWLLGLIFVLALGYSLLGVTHHWTMGYLAGQEFRQTQTALVADYIDRYDNFSLLYETPIFGKPWISNLLEVPLYEWGVVGLSRATGLPHHMSARTISAVCFYLALPAFWLLLGRIGLPPVRRLLPLALILCAPAHIFYTRSFMIDPLALLASSWWLVAFVRTMDTRRWPWLVLAIVAGTVAIVVKSATLAAWLLPGAAYGTWMLWDERRAGAGWRRLLATIAWGLATVAVAFGVLRAWVVYTDPIKAAHPSAWIFGSQALVMGNWGLFDLGALLSADVWRGWMGGWERAIMSRWVLGAGLLAGLMFPGERRRVLGLGAAFFVAQFLFPYAYAYQDYYFYSNAAFVLAALGCALLGALDSRCPRWVVALIFVVPFAAGVHAYRRDYRVEQDRVHDGDQGFTKALRELTPVNAILVVAGADWAPPIPYYARRRALMVRNGLEHDEAYLRRAFADLDDEEVVAVVLHDKLRTNGNFLWRAAVRFDLATAAPTFSAPNVDIYVARPYEAAVRAGLRDTARYPGITVNPDPVLPGDQREPARPVTSEEARGALAGISPVPLETRFRNGAPARQGRRGGEVILAHTPSELWLEPPAHATRIEWGYGIFEEAYERDGDRTDGVDFSIWGEQPDGTKRRIYRKLLDPAREERDRGDQRVSIPYRPRPGERLRFSTEPGGSSAFDWAYLTGIQVK